MAFPVPLKHAILMDISADHAEMLLCRRTGSNACELWAAPLLGGSVRRLGDLVAADATSAAWSPDGQQLAYIKDKALYTARVDGTGSRKLVTVDRTHSAFAPKWSRDGRSVRFSVYNSDNTSVWEVRIDGDHAYQLLPNAGWNPSWSACCGDWTPDGKYFVFDAGPNLNATGDIWAIRDSLSWSQMSERGPFQVTNGLLITSSPVPSADGRRLFIEAGQSRTEFRRYDLKTGRFTPEFRGVSGRELEYSKDAKWLVYVSEPGQSLWRSAADGSQRVQITSPPIRAHTPHWSPDGKQIAFLGIRTGSPARIYVASMDGEDQKQVSKGEAGENGDADPSWSPDGGSLAFGWSGYGNKAPTPRAAIQVVDLKSGRVSTLPGSEGMWSPRWAPNGRFIAGLSAQGSKLVIYDFKTQKQVELSSVRSDYPGWSEDGDSLFYRTTGDDPAWWRVRMRVRRTEHIVDLKSIPEAEGTDLWFAPAPNNSLMTTRIVVNNDIYSLDWNGQ